MMEDFRAGFAYLLLKWAARIYPPLIREIIETVACAAKALAEDEGVHG